MAWTGFPDSQAYYPNRHGMNTIPRVVTNHYPNGHGMDRIPRVITIHYPNGHGMNTIPSVVTIPYLDGHGALGQHPLGVQDFDGGVGRARGDQLPVPAVGGHAAGPLVGGDVAGLVLGGLGGHGLHVGVELQVDAGARRHRVRAADGVLDSAVVVLHAWGQQGGTQGWQPSPQPATAPGKVWERQSWGRAELAEQVGSHSTGEE